MIRTEQKAMQTKWTKIEPFTLKDFCDTQEEIAPLIKGGQGRTAHAVKQDAAGLLSVLILLAIISLVMLACFQ